MYVRACKRAHVVQYGAVRALQGFGLGLCLCRAARVSREGDAVIARSARDPWECCRHDEEGVQGDLECVCVCFISCAYLFCWCSYYRKAYFVAIFKAVGAVRTCSGVLIGWESGVALRCWGRGSFICSACTLGSGLDAGWS